MVTGCASALPAFPWRKMPLDVASGLYVDAALTYRLDAGKLGQPLDVVRVEGQRISYEQVASSPLADESTGTLSVVYPHPSGNTGVALARFVLDSAPNGSKAPTSDWNPFSSNGADAAAPRTTVAGGQPRIHETWELDIAHPELDEIFKQITNIGFYQLERPGPARLTVKLDGVRQSKDWEQIPALNLLIQRIRSQGRLVAYARPTSAAGGSTGAISSTQAYRRLLEDVGMPATSAPTVASAFALAPVGPEVVGIPPGQGVPAGVAGPPSSGYPATPFPPVVAHQPPAVNR